MSYDICLAFVHPGSVRAVFLDSLLRMVTDPRYSLTIVQAESGTNIQIARNQCVREFLENTDASHLFFVDTDVSWDADVPEALISRHVPIVSAVYLGRDADGHGFPVGQAWTGPGAPVFVDENGEVMRRLRMSDLHGLVEVAGVGMGCCMIEREVISALLTADAGSHPDNWPYSIGEVRSGAVYVSVSEDVNFCLRAKDAGFRSYIASDVRAGHSKTFVMSPPVEGPALLRAMAEPMSPLKGNGRK